jgi:cold shock CspA family protein
MAMSVPVQITFRNLDPYDVVEDLIRAEAEKLETFYGGIMQCRVTLEVPHRHHKQGKQYHLRIELTVPGNKLVVSRRPDLGSWARQAGAAELKRELEVESPHKDMRQAIHDAFKAAGRRLEDYVRRRRGQIKIHEPMPKGRVSKLFLDKGYGFLTTPDGREIYFHEDSVLNRNFHNLREVAAVAFVEEQGEKGPQASTVKVPGKRAVPRSAKQPAKTSV